MTTSINVIVHISIFLILTVACLTMTTKTEETPGTNGSDDEELDELIETVSGITSILIIMGIIILALVICHIIIVIRNCISYALLPTYLEDNCLCKTVMMLHPKYKQDPSSDP